MRRYLLELGITFRKQNSILITDFKKEIRANLRTNIFEYVWDRIVLLCAISLEYFGGTQRFDQFKPKKWLNKFDYLFSYLKLVKTSTYPDFGAKVFRYHPRIQVYDLVMRFTNSPELIAHFKTP